MTASILINNHLPDVTEEHFIIKPFSVTKCKVPKTDASYKNLELVSGQQFNYLMAANLRGLRIWDKICDSDSLNLNCFCLFNLKCQTDSILTLSLTLECKIFEDRCFVFTMGQTLNHIKAALLRQCIKLPVNLNSVTHQVLFFTQPPHSPSPNKKKS